MLLCAVGDIHGAIDRMYEDILAFETVLGMRFAWILHVVDFGIWPDPLRSDYYLMSTSFAVAAEPPPMRGHAAASARVHGCSGRRRTPQEPRFPYP